MGWNRGKGFHRLSLGMVAFSRDGRYAAAVESLGVIIWEVETGKQVVKSRLGQGRRLCFSPDGARMTEGFRAIFESYEIATGQKVFRSQPIRATEGDQQGLEIESLAYSPDGKLLAVGGTAIYNKKIPCVVLWDAETFKEVRRFQGDRSVVALAFSPDGKILATASGKDSSVSLWEVETGKEIHHLRKLGGWIVGVAFSPDGKELITPGSADPAQGLRVWDVATGKLSRRLVPIQASNVATAVSRLGWIAAGGPVGITVWKATANHPLYQIRCNVIQEQSLAFSPDGRYLLAAEPEAAVLYEAGTGQEIRRFVPETGPR